VVRRARVCDWGEALVRVSYSDAFPGKSAGWTLAPGEEFGYWETRAVPNPTRPGGPPIVYYELPDGRG
jgi:hypothetical protein